MSTYQPGFDNHPDIAAVKVQMVQLNQSVTTFTFITQDTLESFLWEAMLELELSMYKDILAARKRLQGFAHATPILTSQTLDQMIGAQVFLKCENYQKIGAFKFRGAFNAMSQLSNSQRRQGVVTFSSGNHAQAVALVGRMLDIPTTVVMPNDAPQIKRNATIAYGAKVITYGPGKSSREEIAANLQVEHGYTLIPPFDHSHIIAGQSTAALELMEKVQGLDWLLVPCGGGGY